MLIFIASFKKKLKCRVCCGKPRTCTAFPAAASRPGISWRNPRPLPLPPPSPRNDRTRRRAGGKNEYFLIVIFYFFLCEISPSPAWRRMRAPAAGRWRGSPRPPWTLEKRNSTASIECEMDNLVGRRNSVFGDFSLFSRQFLLPFSPIQHVRY